MSVRAFAEYAEVFALLVAMTTLALMTWRRQYRSFAALFALLSGYALGSMEVLVLVVFRSRLGLPTHPAYKVYFVTFWVMQASNLAFTLGIIQAVYAEAMRPFPGLQRIGKIVFRWVGVVSLLVAFALATGPQIFSKSTFGIAAIQEVFAHIEQGINVLVLCLLIFVCFAIRPLGLTFRSRVFGVILGLGICSCVDLIQAAWIATLEAHSIFSPVYTFGVLGSSIAVCVWGVYFAMPEPERKMILLPTTSPFFLWNRISEILGDAPGNVVVAGFNPNMLAAGEIAMLTAATAEEAAAARDREAMEVAELDAGEPFAELAAPTATPFALSR